MSPAAREMRVSVGSIEARVLVSGPDEAEEAAVFLHGNPGSADDFAELVGVLGGSMRAVALDLPDFGKTSAGPGFVHSADGYAEFLEHALHELGVRRAHLVLHDFGGAVGLTWAANSPERVGSLSLIDVGVVPGYRWHWMARVWRTPLLGELVQAATTRAAFRRSMARTEPRGLPAEAVDRMYDQYDRRTRRAVLRLYRATGVPGQEAQHVVSAMAGKPVLVIWGEHDAFLPSSWAHRQPEFFPGAEVQVLPASGHWPFLDAPQPVARLLTRFLAGQLSPAAA